MPQTILAILALMMATTMVLQQQRNILSARAQLIRNELALQGTGVAESVLSEIGGMEFDEATAALGQGESLNAPSELTASGDLGPEGGAPNDIDDFHGQVLEEQRLFRGDTLRFEVKVNVTYADENDMKTPRSSQTKVKKATVTVYSKDISDPVEIRVSRSYACGSKCDW